MDVLPEIAGSTPIAIAADVARAIRAATVAAMPQEACGLIFANADGHIVSASIARNIAESPRHRFEIDPAHLFAAHRGVRGSPLRIAGCWHSHPNGRATPSRHDFAGVGDTGWLWLIAAADLLHAFRPESGGFRAVGLVEASIPAVAPPLAGR